MKYWGSVWAGLVGGQILYTDSTHIKAKANKHKKRLVTVEETPAAYMAELDAQIDPDHMYTSTLTCKSSL